MGGGRGGRGGRGGDGGEVVGAGDEGEGYSWMPLAAQEGLVHLLAACMLRAPGRVKQALGHTERGLGAVDAGLAELGREASAAAAAAGSGATGRGAAGGAPIGPDQLCEGHLDHRQVSRARVLVALRALLLESRLQLRLLQSDFAAARADAAAAQSLAARFGVLLGSLRASLHMQAALYAHAVGEWPAAVRQYAAAAAAAADPATEQQARGLAALARLAQGGPEAGEDPVVGGGRGRSGGRRSGGAPRAPRLADPPPRVPRCLPERCPGTRPGLGALAPKRCRGSERPSSGSHPPAPGPCHCGPPPPQWARASPCWGTCTTRRPAATRAARSASSRRPRGRCCAWRRRARGPRTRRSCRRPRWGRRTRRGVQRGWRAAAGARRAAGVLRARRGACAGTSFSPALLMARAGALMHPVSQVLLEPWSPDAPSHSQHAGRAGQGTEVGTQPAAQPPDDIAAARCDGAAAGAALRRWGGGLRGRVGP